MYHCNTNNGTEHLNEDLKYEKLEGATRSLLSELLTNIIERFVPKLYMKYVEMYNVLADTKVIMRGVYSINTVFLSQLIWQIPTKH